MNKVHKGRYSVAVKRVLQMCIETLYEISAFPRIYLSFRLPDVFYESGIVGYPESFRESTRVVTISLLLSALRLRWREATLAIIVFKRAEKFIVKAGVSRRRLKRY